MGLNSLLDFRDNAGNQVDMYTLDEMTSCLAEFTNGRPEVDFELNPGATGEGGGLPVDEVFEEVTVFLEDGIGDVNVLLFCLGRTHGSGKVGEFFS